MNKLVLGFASLAAATLFAAAGAYKVNILEDTTLAGKQIKAGDYKVEVEGNTATLKHGKTSVSFPAHTEQAASKYNNTQIQYVNNAIHEIHVGGTNTKIVFSPEPTPSASGTN
jgi:hypothetical protein